MIVTPEQAKTKWCPHVRHGGDTSSFNRGSEPGNAINDGRPNREWRCCCIGSDCMMWRWLQAPMRQVSNKPVDGWEHVPADDSGEYAEHWLEPWESAQSKRLGYCALAGKPENLNA